jgi:AcrR family transcriptional regulator
LSTRTSSHPATAEPDADQRPEEGTRARRADALRNRARIREVAEEVFAEQGVGAPVDEIARRAGVGVGTLYRHYPTKEQLVEAIIVERFEQMLAHARELTQAADPTEAFFEFLERMVQLGVAKQDFADTLARAGIDVSAGHAEHFEEMMGVAGELLARAQAAGGVRPDVTVSDLCYLMSGACSAGCPSAGPGGSMLASSPDHLLRIISAGLRP